ncbi:MAG: hypothetical protein KF830_05885 [Planctomycetes bacterium]|nr:hypothetical protein [Planctomycetota bacterium]
MDGVPNLVGAALRLLRRANGRPLGALTDLAAEPASNPAHGGVTAAERAPADPEADRRERRRAQLAELLGLPPGTQVDLVVDASAEELTFVVRDRATGRTLRAVPEAEARQLIERFQARFGAFVDRAL